MFFHGLMWQKSSSKKSSKSSIVDVPSSNPMFLGGGKFSPHRLAESLGKTLRPTTSMHIKDQIVVDHNIAVARSATVAVSTRRRCGPSPTAVAPASCIEFTSAPVKSPSGPMIIEPMDSL